jgi:hypothetical protein
VQSAADNPDLLWRNRDNFLRFLADLRLLGAVLASGVSFTVSWHYWALSPFDSLALTCLAFGAVLCTWWLNGAFG